MSEYEFTLKFRLPDASADPAQFIDALAEAGCDDALVGVGQVGCIALDFTREASSAFQAIASATERQAGHSGRGAGRGITRLRQHHRCGRTCGRTDSVLLEVAETKMTVNIAKEARRLPGAVLPKELAPLFA